MPLFQCLVLCCLSAMPRRVIPHVYVLIHLSISPIRPTTYAPCCTSVTPKTCTCRVPGRFFVSAPRDPPASLHLDLHGGHPSLSGAWEISVFANAQVSMQFPFSNTFSSFALSTHAPATFPRPLRQDSRGEIKTYLRTRPAQPIRSFIRNQLAKSQHQPIDKR